MRVSSMLVLLGSLLALAACAHESPTSPTPVVNASPTVVGRPATEGYLLYEFVDGLPDPVSANTTYSSYWLYDTGDFKLVLGNDGIFTGTYTRTDAGFALSFTPSADQPPLYPPGPWKATGTLSGNELTVRYSAEMKTHHFEDGVYKLH